MTTHPLNSTDTQAPFRSSSSSPASRPNTQPTTTTYTTPSQQRPAMPPQPIMTLNPSYCHPAFFTTKLRRSPSFTLQPGPHSSSSSSSSHVVNPVVHGYMFQDAQRLQGPGPGPATAASLGKMRLGSVKVAAGGSSRL